MIFRYPPKLSIADNYRPIQKQNYSRPLTYINRKAMYHLIPTKYFFKIGFFFAQNQWTNGQLTNSKQFDPLGLFTDIISSSFLFLR